MSIDANDPRLAFSLRTIRDSTRCLRNTVGSIVTGEEEVTHSLPMR